MSWKKLLILQYIYPILGIVYLLLSYSQIKTGGQSFSKVSPIEAISIFAVYAVFLLSGVFKKYLFYRIICGVFILVLGTGGVFGNILNFMRTGLEGYSSLLTWSIGVGINLYGLIWNAVGVFGLFRR